MERILKKIVLVMSIGMTLFPCNNVDENLCRVNEEVLFSFKTANESKTLSVCISKTQPDYIVYRFGTKDNIELEFPINKTDSCNNFTYSYYFRGGGTFNEGLD